MSPVRKKRHRPRCRSMTEEYPSAFSPFPLPLPRPFQLRDKGLLRYRLHPSPKKGSSSRSANKTPWPCFTRDIKRVARLFPLGSLLCKRRTSSVYWRALGHPRRDFVAIRFRADGIIRLQKQMAGKMRDERRN